jgi:hypothetical protein
MRNIKHFGLSEKQKKKQVHGLIIIIPTPAQPPKKWAFCALAKSNSISIP